VNCPNCGTTNLDNASICVNCGRPLSSAAGGYTPPPPPAPAPHASYVPPPSSGPGFGASAATPAEIPNYLWQSIVVTLCCCLPFGIVGIIFASQVNDKLRRGDVAGAMAASKNAKTWVLVGFICGLVGIVLYALFFGGALIQAIHQSQINH
jgi:interferon-induced transmembrane protein/zinc ribbon protein